MFNERILYQNTACIVINKQKGESMQGAKDGIVNLPKELNSFLKTDFVQAVHRLDVPVTGCALFATTKPALIFLFDAFSRRDETQIEKRYWAIAEKPEKLPPESGELVHWIEIKAGKNKSIAHSEEAADRKKASLRYKITGEGKNYLYIEAELLSGRHHQIRAQLAAIGLHIKGDVKYGAKRSEKEGGIRLHARSLAFPNPLNKKEIIRVTAAPPSIDNLWSDFINTELKIE